MTLAEPERVRPMPKVRTVRRLLHEQTGPGCWFFLLGLYLSFLVMPRIGELFGVFFYIYFREHGVPHIHALYNGKVAVIALDGVVLEGKLPRKQLKIARKFVLDYATEILARIEEIEASQKGTKPAPKIKRIPKTKPATKSATPKKKP